MAYVRRLPPDPELLSLREQGWTYREIGDEYGVSASAVSHQLTRLGATRGRRDLGAHIPWQVSAEHSQHKAVRMLRLLAERDAGTLPQERVKALDEWLTWLADNTRVVCYSPGRGFTYGRRRPTDGGSLTRP